MSENKLCFSDRRNFIKTGVAALGAAAALPRALQAQGQAGAAELSFALEELSLMEMQRSLHAGMQTARSLAEQYLARIQQIDQSGPELRAVIELNPDTMVIADELDRERKQKGSRGLLHGIPVLIKDNIGTADRMETTAGSLALVGARPAKDSMVAQRLREAGALILGKTNLSEWANFRSTHSTSGWSGRGGQTKMPYALDRNPSGSSSGSGVAVSANLCAVAVGTETDGSIVSPANNNGIVGIKPTVGLVSRSGIVPISHTQDTAGPMARTVADAAALLSVLAGVDEADEAGRAAAGHVERDYTRFLDARGLKGARLGVVRKYAGYDRHVDKLFDDAISAMKSAGAEIVDPVEIDTLGKFDDAEQQVLLYEFKTDLERYLAALPKSQCRTMKELIEFNDRNAERELRYFGQELFIQAEAKGPLSSSEYTKALEQCRRMSRAEGIDGAIEKHKLDALIAPTGNAAWTTDLLNGDRFTGSDSTLAAVAGYPHVTVPMGFIFGLPVGVSFFGKAWSEGPLIKLAYAYEQMTKHRQPPRFRPVVDLAAAETS